MFVHLTHPSSPLPHFRHDFSDCFVLVLPSYSPFSSVSLACSPHPSSLCYPHPHFYYSLSSHCVDGLGPSFCHGAPLPYPCPHRVLVHRCPPPNTVHCLFFLLCFCLSFCFPALVFFAWRFFPANVSLFFPVPVIFFFYFLSCQPGICSPCISATHTSRLLALDDGFAFAIAEFFLPLLNSHPIEIFQSKDCL